MLCFLQPSQKEGLKVKPTYNSSTVSKPTRADRPTLSLQFALSTPAQNNRPSDSTPCPSNKNVWPHHPKWCRLPEFFGTTGAAFPFLLFLGKGVDGLVSMREVGWRGQKGRHQRRANVGGTLWGLASSALAHNVPAIYVTVHPASKMFGYGIRAGQDCALDDVTSKLDLDHIFPRFWGRGVKQHQLDFSFM